MEGPITRSIGQKDEENLWKSSPSNNQLSKILERRRKKSQEFIDKKKKLFEGKNLNIRTIEKYEKMPEIMKEGNPINERDRQNKKKKDNRKKKTKEETKEETKNKHQKGMKNNGRKLPRRITPFNPYLDEYMNKFIKNEKKTLNNFKEDSSNQPNEKELHKKRKNKNKHQNYQRKNDQYPIQQKEAEPFEESLFYLVMVNLSHKGYNSSHLNIEKLKKNSSPFFFISNLIFLTRMFLCQIILVSLPLSPNIQLILLASIELIYFTVNIASFVLARNFKYCFYLIPRVLQSLSLLIIYLNFYFILRKSIEGDEDTMRYQEIVILVFCISALVDIAFMLAISVLEIIAGCRKKKDKVKDNGEKEGF